MFTTFLVCMTLGGPVTPPIDVAAEIAHSIQHTYYTSAKTAWHVAGSAKYYSKRYNVPLSLILSVAAVESSFRPDAVSPCGAS